MRVAQELLNSDKQALTAMYPSLAMTQHTFHLRAVQAENLAKRFRSGAEYIHLHTHTQLTLVLAAPIPLSAAMVGS
eukprot:scaffold131163_cov24-Tisochrysis_lutea.AAC.1